MTPDPLERESFGRLIAALGYPAVGGVAEGEAAWRDMLARGGRADRRLWLSQLERHLLKATPYGARRAAAHDAHRGKIGPPLDIAAAHTVVDSALLYYGGRRIRATVVEAIASLPEHARRVALDTATWIGVGDDAAAWTSAARFVDDEGHTRARIVACAERTTLHIVRHEVGHLWHANDAPAEQHHAITTAGEAALLEHARDAGWLEQLRRHEDVSELLAESLALIWGWQAEPEG